MNTPQQASLQLRDIHLPGTPDIWPPAPGWWLLFGILLLLMIAVGVLAWRRIELRRQRRRVLELLDEIERSSAGNATPGYLAQLSRLIRALALAHFPRQEIASLTGRDWLRFLDSSGGNGQFEHGPGRVLAEGPYMRELPDGVDGRALAALVRRWISRNSGN